MKRDGQLQLEGWGGGVWEGGHQYVVHRGQARGLSVALGVREGKLPLPHPSILFNQA